MSRKYLLDWGVKCMRVFVFMFVLMKPRVNCVFCVRGRLKKNRERKQQKKKKIRRSGSRRLPGIVRITEERGWPRKSENITEGGAPISGNHTVCLTGSNTTFIQSSLVAPSVSQCSLTLWGGTSIFCVILLMKHMHYDRQKIYYYLIYLVCLLISYSVINACAGKTYYDCAQ